MELTYDLLELLTLNFMREIKNIMPDIKLTRTTDSIKTEAIMFQPNENLQLKCVGINFFLLYYQTF